jgi:hypothetical protein
MLTTKDGRIAALFAVTSKFLDLTVHAFQRFFIAFALSIRQLALKTKKAEAKFEGWFNKPILSTTQRRTNIAIRQDQGLLCRFSIVKDAEYTSVAGVLP